MVLVFVSNDANAQSTSDARHLPKFMGRNITIVEPELEDEFFPKGPASLCVEGPPQKQCYTHPRDFGRTPTVEVVQLEKGLAAILFSAASGGVSGWRIHFALLRPGTGKDLEDLFLSDTTVSNQSRYAFWNQPAISNVPMFVTADYVSGPDEAHYDKHRYMISTYVGKRSTMLGDRFYYLEDRYMTAHTYDLDGGGDILTSEKQEILARLRRLKAQTELRQ